MTSHAADNHRAYLERSLGAHAAYSLHYHLVWSVKARRPLLHDAVALALRDHLVRVGEQADIHILAFHIEPEHVHVLMSLSPGMAVATAVQRLKGSSSRHLRQAFRQLAELHEGALWNTGYFVRSLGEVSVAQAKAYLDRQRERHGL
ncbi:MAG TPA: IS200/IS605 family transposase [Chloroflexota bacterium]|nr:IS200/IS605 family transposase [Chloroflexota bacterium]